MSNIYGRRTVTYQNSSAHLEGFEDFISDPQPDNLLESSFIVISLQKTQTKKHKIYLLSSWPDCKLQVWEGSTLVPSKPAGVI